MDFTPFTPARSALGDISNQKLFRSAVKTPFPSIKEEIEKVYGFAIAPEMPEIEIYPVNYSKSPLSSLKLEPLEEKSFPIELEDFSDPGFSDTEKEIEKYLNQGVILDNIN
ncbi:hypothetical protein SteCoe_22674 [Stentor coeruleus]|uniref:Uncharacterized protein n=1 Tax=Stentor coeruleus TaxID=5963 RepID=A0A1R2BLT3_9CILI|nr:hypothetical protein SteCoe_22674 [Stentor coeruleus]